MDKNVLNLFEEILKKIKNKKFLVETPGYDMSDVDSFLDELSENIDLIRNQFSKIDDQLNNLKLEILNINRDYERIYKQCELYNKILNKNLTDSGSYLNILDRVSKLEDGLNKKK